MKYLLTFFKVLKMCYEIVNRNWNTTRSELDQVSILEYTYIYLINAYLFFQYLSRCDWLPVKYFTLTLKIVAKNKSQHGVTRQKVDDEHMTCTENAIEHINWKANP